MHIECIPFPSPEQSARMKKLDEDPATTQTFFIYGIFAEVSIVKISKRQNVGRQDRAYA